MKIEVSWSSAAIAHDLPAIAVTRPQFSLEHRAPVPLEQQSSRGTLHALQRCMTHNTSTLDRIIRLVAGLVLIALVFVGPQTPLGWLGLVLIGTSAIGFCPLYRIFGISSYAART